MARVMNEGLVRFRVAGFASLRDVTLEPGPLTVMIGANGSGKSNVLRALRLLEKFRSGSLQRFVAESGGASKILHYGPKRTSDLTIDVEWLLPTGKRGYHATLAFAQPDRLAFIKEWFECPGADPGGNRRAYEPFSHDESGLATATDRYEVESLLEVASSVATHHVSDTSHNSPLRVNSRSADDQSMRSDGANLAAFLRRLKDSPKEEARLSWRRINTLVSRIAPSIKSLEPTFTDDNAQSVRLDWIDDRDERFGVHQLSDGTLRAIAIITALAQPESRRPRFISIDEPELGLHPVAIRIVAELARSISHHTQVLFATQSPAFLDHFRPEEVVVAERVKGATELKRLPLEDMKDWLSEYSLSELHDKGVLGGRP